MFSPPILPFSYWSSWLRYLMHHCFFYAFFHCPHGSPAISSLWTLILDPPTALLVSSSNLPLKPTVLTFLEK